MPIPARSDRARHPGLWMADHGPGIIVLIFAIPEVLASVCPGEMPAFACMIRTERIISRIIIPVIFRPVEKFGIISHLSAGGQKIPVQL